MRFKPFPLLTLPFLAFTVALASLAGSLALLPGPATAAAKNRCFGKPATQINRPGTHHLKRFEAVVVNARASILAKGDNRICAGRGTHGINLRLGKGTRNLVKLGAGNDVIRVKGPTLETRIDAGGGDNRIFVEDRARKHKIESGDGNDRVVLRAKATSYSVRTGGGNDRVDVRKPAKAAKRVIDTGLGDDVVKIRAKGNTEARLGPASNPHGVSDNDFYAGGHSNDAVLDEGGINYIAGNNGVDTIRSLGTARSRIFGGNGSDRIHSNGADQISGGRGNDRILANERGSIGGVVADGGAGDDWLYGTDHDDILMGSTGVDKYRGFGGDDLFRADDGLNNIDGGGGTNTVSFAAHTPPGYSNRTGVLVDLRQGIARGGTSTQLANIQNVIGSSFDDIIRTDSRQPSEVWGGLGDDEIEANGRDTIHPPFQPEEQPPCRPDRRRKVTCEPPPPPPGPERPALGVSPDGVLTIMGGTASDAFSVDAVPGGRYAVTSARPFAHAVEHCTVSGSRAECSIPDLRNVLVYGGPGDDRITVGDSIPRDVSTVLDGGDGNNFVQGGPASDYIYTGRGQSTLRGGAGDDVIKASEGGATVIDGESGHDLLRVTNPCLGHSVAGGAGKDNVVFAGSAHGVEVNFTKGLARWRGGPGSCAASRIANSVESAEGSRHADRFIAPRRGGASFLGRQGADIFITRNGRRDTITTGPGGRRNKVKADRFDKVTFGWGFAAF